MSDLRVSSDAVQVAAASTQSKVAEFEARVTAFDAFVSSLIGDGWAGSAATAFDTDYSEWLDGARLVHEALGRVASLLASASETYETTETTVTSASTSSQVSADIKAKG